MIKMIGLLTAGFITLQSFTLTVTELTRPERDAAIKYFKETGEYFSSRVKGLTDAQLDFKDDPDNWSIRDCVEHITLSETFIVSVVESLLKQPANPEKKSEVKFSEEMLKTALLDRSKKGQAPEPLKPGGKFKTAGEAVASFTTARDANIRFLDTTKESLRDHLMPHPFFGMLDAYQWMILLAGHTKRHTLQIEEIMAAPDFPKS